MSNVTIDKIEYQTLKSKAEKYDRIALTVEADFFAPPPVRSRKSILDAMARTRRYSKQFLDGLRRGLRRSSYFTA